MTTGRINQVAILSRRPIRYCFWNASRVAWSFEFLPRLQKWFQTCLSVRFQPQGLYSYWQDMALEHDTHRHQASKTTRQVYQTNIFLGLQSKAVSHKEVLQTTSHRRKLNRRAGQKAKLYCPFFQMIRCVHLPLRQNVHTLSFLARTLAISAQTPLPNAPRHCLSSHCESMRCQKTSEISPRRCKC